MNKNAVRLILILVALSISMLLLPRPAHADFGTPTVNILSPVDRWGGINVNVTVTLSGGGGGTDWLATAYRWNGTGDWNCINHANETSNGTHTLNLNMITPTTAGSHTLNVRAHNSNTCNTGGPGNEMSDVANVTNVAIAQNNPDLPASCGVNVILVLDESGSIVSIGGSNNILTDVRGGAIALWNALQGTGSTMTVVEFNTNARLTPIQTLPITAGANFTAYQAYINGTAGGANSANRYNPGEYGTVNDPGDQVYTNWQAALDTTYNNLGATDLVLFFTDGVPTTNNDIPNDEPEDNYSNANSARHNHLAPAGVIASAIKNAGVRLFGVGIANGSDPATTLPYISGTTAFTPGNPNMSVADYITLTQQNANQFGQSLRDLVTEICQGTANVTKEVWDNDANNWVPAAGWQYTATASPATPPFQWTAPVPPAPSSDASRTGTTTAPGGGVSFKWTPTNPVNPTTITLSEALQDGYEHVSVSCQNQANQNVSVTATLVGDAVNLSGFNVPNDGYVSCTFHNTQALLDITKTAPQSTYAPGAQFTYALEYSNVTTGDGFGSTAYSPVVSDVLPADLKFISAAPQSPPGTCSHTGEPFGGTVTCSGMNNLPEGTSRIINLTVQVQGTNFAIKQVLNTACVDADDSRGNPLAQECGPFTITTPVTVSYFAATSADGGVRFDWSTATETANAGFNLYANTADGLVKLNDVIILSTVIDSSAPTDYSVFLSGVPEGEYYIEDVSLTGQVRAHEAIGLNKSFGDQVMPPEIDWAAIHAENTALEQARTAAAMASAAQTTAPRGLPSADGLTDGAETAAVSASPSLDLRVRESGIYRLTYEQIKAAGVDLAGVARRNLAITNRGEPVYTYVSKAVFGPGAYIEFIGEGLDTLYTDANVYRLAVNRSLAGSVATSAAQPPRGANYASYYMETTTIENNKAYSYLSPNGDPWYDTVMNVTPSSATKHKDFSVNVSDYVPGAPASVQFDLWGASELIDGPDHHALLAVNGTQVADELFDNNEIKIINAQLPNGVLTNGANTLRLTAPADRGAEFDTFAVESYGLTYPRAFKAVNGRLDFEAQSRAFRVTGLNSDQVVVYRVAANGRPVRLTGAKVQSDGASYRVSFAGNGANATYYVSTTGAMLTPQISLTPAAADIKSGTADLLIIAHPNFINGDLNRLVAARQAQGYKVKVVDVTQVYAQYSGGNFDPQAIRDYISHAIQNMGVEYVLLVGGDTRDYRNYGGGNSISFIPSLYANTLDPVKLAPVDPLYTDVNGDNVPDRAIGRFPVRTVAELKLMVDKTLLYDARADVQTAIFAADDGFESDSDAFASSLSGWTVEKAYVRLMGNSAARTALINALNAGPRLASFVGHSGPTNWTFAPLFRASDAKTLTNVDMPTLVTQWGCWNTYYVDPRYDTLGHLFLLSGMNGASLVTGSSTLTDSDSERALGERLMARVTQTGMTVGEAMQAAKVDLAATHPEMKDVLLGWTILGDPTVKVRP